MLTTYIDAPIDGVVDLTARRFTGTVDDGVIVPPPPPPPDPAADRINVADVSGGLAAAILMGRPLWVPNGPHVLPANVKAAMDIDVLCESADARVTLKSSTAFIGDAGKIRWEGGTLEHAGGAALVALNDSTVFPPELVFRRAKFVGVSPASHPEWKDDRLGMVGRLEMFDLDIDLLHKGRGPFLQNGVVIADCENVTVRRYLRMGFMVACHGSWQQERTQKGRFHKIAALDGIASSTASAINANGIYLGGRNIEASVLRVEKLYPIEPDGSGGFKARRDVEGLYHKIQRSRFYDVTLIDAGGHQAMYAPKGDNDETAGRTHGNDHTIEKLYIERTADFPAFAGATGVWNQVNGSTFIDVTTVNLKGQALRRHEGAGPITIHGWEDRGRPANTPPSDKGIAVFQPSGKERFTIFGRKNQPQAETGWRTYPSNQDMTIIDDRLPVS